MLSHSSLLHADTWSNAELVRAWSSKKSPCYLLQELDPLFPSFLALRVTAEVLLSQPGGHFLWVTSSSSFSAFGATELPAEPCGFRGTQDKMTKSRLSATRRRPLQPRCADKDSSSPLPHLGQQCLGPSASLPLLRLLLASCPAPLPSFALTPVIGW